MATGRQQQELSFSLEDLRAIARRRRWWFVAPVVGGLLIGLAAALLLPAEYEAAAIVVVEPQGVPELLVQSTVSSDTESRFGQIKLQILSRDNLVGIIDEFGLYEDQVGSTPVEELVLTMREKIEIEPLPPAIVDPRKPIEIQSFRIAFRAPAAQMAADVANRLTRDFLNANLRDRTAIAEGTSEFIAGELVKTEEERARLLSELMTYREEHQGELPGDLATNQMRLERLEQTQRDTRAQLHMAEQQTRQIRRQIHGVRESGSDETSDPVSRKRQLELMINQHLAQGKTEKHPDVVIARAELAQLTEMLHAQLELDVPLSPAEAVLHTELRNFEVRTDVLQRQLQILDGQVTEIEERVGATPKRMAYVSQIEANITGLTEQIRDLHGKKIAADLGQSVELVQKGEKFRVVESAVPPTSPVFPNRPLVIMVGTVLGLGLGVFLLAVREMTDQSFHAREDLQQALQLPVLGTIPVIQLPAELARARLRLRRLALTGVALVALVAGGTLLVYLINNASSSDVSAWFDSTPKKETRADV
jgi:polysaccharide chain length determinant protein (PEP-CTERM system associated)